MRARWSRPRRRLPRGARRRTDDRRYVLRETAAAEEAIAENPQSVADYKAGKEKALNALVGAVMKKTRGRADARTARDILLEKLG